jgi:hypothetical protein
MISQTGNTDAKLLADNISIDCVAVYSNKKKAMEVAKEMEDNHSKVGFSSEAVYDVFEFTLDAEPLLLDFQRKKLKQIEETNDKVDEALTELMKTGHVDQLIGEDGHFYYELTSEGRAVAHKIPELVKKLFKKD